MDGRRSDGFLHGVGWNEMGRSRAKLRKKGGWGWVSGLRRLGGWCAESDRMGVHVTGRDRAGLDGMRAGLALGGGGGDAGGTGCGLNVG